MAKTATKTVAPSGKARLIRTKTEGSVITFTVGEAGSFDLDTSAVSDEIRTLATFHGFRQKVSDAAALKKDDPNNNPAGKLAAMLAVRDAILEGDWSQRSGDGSSALPGVIYRAYARWVAEQAEALGKAAPSPEKSREVYDGKDRKAQLALRNVPRIAEIIEELKAERGPATPIDTGDLLAELGLAE